MKLKLRVLSVCLILSFMIMACGSAAGNLDTESLSVDVDSEDTDVVTDPTEESTEEIVKEIVEESTEEGTEENSQLVEEETEPELTPEQIERLAWENALIANVEESLNVRTEADEESDLAGKLAKGDRAQILESSSEWTKIQSGELIGYVKNEYCIFGLNALAHAKENFDTIATVNIEGLRIRKEMDTESTIIRRLEEGDELVVDTQAEVEEGWVAVKYKGGTYYVSEKYVTVSMKVGTGLTMAQIEEIRRAEEKAKKKAEQLAAQQAMQQASQQKPSQQQSSSNNNTAANVDDLTLMAAIIYCEAGGEPYETQLAVGAVIMNRVQSVGYPNSLYGVIYQRGQFGPARTGKLERVLRQGKATSSCYRAAQEALNGADNTNGCFFFNDYNGTRDGIRYGGMVFW